PVRRQEAGRGAGGAEMKRAAVAALAVALGCGPDYANQPIPPRPPSQNPPPVVAQPGAPGAKPAPPKPIDPVKKALLDEVRRRSFRSEDFVESESNRDPFRSFLHDFAGGTTVTTQYKILLPKYSLDELKLIAIVGPPTEDLHGRAVPVRGEGGYTHA